VGQPRSSEAKTTWKKAQRGWRQGDGRAAPVQLLAKALRTPRAMGKKSALGSVHLKLISSAGKPDN